MNNEDYNDWDCRAEYEKDKEFYDTVYGSYEEYYEEYKEFMERRRKFMNEEFMERRRKFMNDHPEIEEREQQMAERRPVKRLLILSAECRTGSDKYLDPYEFFSPGYYPFSLEWDENGIPIIPALKCSMVYTALDFEKKKVYRLSCAGDNGWLPWEVDEETGKQFALPAGCKPVLRPFEYVEVTLSSDNAKRDSERPFNHEEHIAESVFPCGLKAGFPYYVNVDYMLGKLTKGKKLPFSPVGRMFDGKVRRGEDGFCYVLEDEASEGSVWMCCVMQGESLHYSGERKGEFLPGSRGGLWMGYYELGREDGEKKNEKPMRFAYVGYEQPPETIGPDCLAVFSLARLADAPEKGSGRHYVRLVSSLDPYDEEKHSPLQMLREGKITGEQIINKGYKFEEFSEDVDIYCGNVLFRVLYDKENNLYQSMTGAELEDLIQKFLAKKKTFNQIKKQYGICIFEYNPNEVESDESRLVFNTRNPLFKEMTGAERNSVIQKYREGEIGVGYLVERGITVGSPKIIVLMDKENPQYLSATGAELNDLIQKFKDGEIGEEEIAKYGFGLVNPYEVSEDILNQDPNISQPLFSSMTGAEINVIIQKLNEGTLSDEDLSGHGTANYYAADIVCDDRIGMVFYDPENPHYLEMTGKELKGLIQKFCTGEISEDELSSYGFIAGDPSETDCVFMPPIFDMRNSRFLEMTGREVNDLLQKVIAAEITEDELSDYGIRYKVVQEIYVICDIGEVKVLYDYENPQYLEMTVAELDGLIRKFYAEEVSVSEIYNYGLVFKTPHDPEGEFYRLICDVKNPLLSPLKGKELNCLLQKARAGILSDEELAGYGIKRILG